MRFRTRLVGIARWFFVEPVVVWVTILAPIGAVYVMHLLPIPSEAAIRAAGFTITLFGVALVAKAIFETQILFQRPTMRSRVKAWLQRLLPLLRRTQVIHGQASITLPAITVSGRGYARVGPREPASLDSRVEAIEENLRRVDDRITETERRIDDDIRRVSVQVSSESAARERAVDTIDRRLADYSAGGLDWEIAGAVWVVVGQALGSFPSEIANAIFG